MTVESFAGSKESVKEIMDHLVDAAKKAPSLKLLGKEAVEPIKLSDGTDAMFLKAEFVKEESRHSLQMKLVTKDASSNAWIVSGHLVASRESKWPTTDSRLAKWLEAHIKSSCLHAKEFEADKVQAAYDNRDEN